MNLLSKILLGLVAVICVQAILIVAGHHGIFPQTALANFIVSIDEQWLKSAIVAAGALVCWSVLYAIVHRHQFIFWLGTQFPPAGEPPRYQPEGIFWVPIWRKWLAEWRASTTAVELGYRPCTFTIWVGQVQDLDAANRHYIEHRVTQLEEDIREYVEKNGPTCEETLEAARKIIGDETNPSA